MKSFGAVRLTRTAPKPAGSVITAPADAAAQDNAEFSSKDEARGHADQLCGSGSAERMPSQ
jgi:hypothetical protein